VHLPIHWLTGLVTGVGRSLPRSRGASSWLWTAGPADYRGFARLPDALMLVHTAPPQKAGFSLERPKGLRFGLDNLG
jgi:hypothetical protein